MVHAIIVLPGTTGTNLLKARNLNPSPPPPAPAAVWMDGVIADAKNKDATQGIAAGTAAMQQQLYASLPAGHRFDPLAKDFKTSGYIALIDSIVAAAKQLDATYQAVYASWPTSIPPVLANSTPTPPWLAPLTGNAVIGFGYDWRWDNSVSAAMLQNFVYNLCNDNAIDKITLVGHSMGGLVSRTWLEVLGPATKDPNIAKVDKLITLGTPHLGAPLALAPISHTLDFKIGGSGDVFVELLNDLMGGATQAELDNMVAIIDAVVNSNPWGVSTYQLMPPNLIASANKEVAAYTAFIDDTSVGTSYPVYPFANLPQALQGLLTGTGMLPTTNLQQAINLFNSLSYTTNPNPNITYECLFGVVEDKDGYRPPLLLRPLYDTCTGFTYAQSPTPTLTPVWTPGGGDLIVPIDSAQFLGNTSPSVIPHEVPGADHLTMPSNPAIQKMVNALINFAS